MNLNLEISLVRRLRESSKFWYQALNDYNDLDSFLSSINALIQSLRNITFIIQSNKESIPNFEKWYSAKQTQMKKDVVLKWLISKRNQIVKVKDLELKSVAEVTISNWLDVKMFRKEFPAVTQNDVIKKEVYILLQKINKAILITMREPLLQIKRSWIEVELPENELLKTLAYCYVRLRELVIETLKLIEPKYVFPEIESDSSLLKQFVPETKRTSYIDMKSWDNISTEEKPIDFNPKLVPKVIKLYGGFPKFPDSNNPFDFIKPLKKFAKIALVKDGYHIPLLIIFREKLPLKMLLIPTRNKTEQYSLVRKIAEEVKTEDITGLLFVLEEWIYPRDNYNKHNRLEALAIIVINRELKYECHMLPFKKDKDNNITISDEIILDSLSDAYWLQPIISAWKSENI